MANYQAILRLRPEVRDFIRNRRWVHRGDIISYGPNIRCDAFSTDEQGFRHSVFEGETLAVADCLQRDRYGLVLGSSHLYGFGVAGNENTIPSLLAERFGFPFGNVSIPEAAGRNLYALLHAFMATAQRPPAIVVLMTGGDFTSFCFTGIADPVFGSPNLKQVEAALKERRTAPDPTLYYPALLGFSLFWTRMMVEHCRRAAVPVMLASDTTFFEKREPTPTDAQCGLGVSAGPAQQRQFEIHKAHFRDFCSRRSALCTELGVPIAGPGSSNDLTFIDEFHYDREATRHLADDYAAVIEGLL